MKPENPSPGEIAGKPKPSSASAEEGKSSGSRSSGSKRRLREKTTAVANDEAKQFADEFERQLDKVVEMELGKADKSKDRRPKGDDVDYTPSSDYER